MAIDYLNVDRNKQLGNKTVTVADRLRQLREDIDMLMDAADHSNDGSNWTTLEANFGLAAGKGANFATLLVQLRDIFNTNATVAGATRLAQIEEFVARLAGQ